MKRTEVTSSIRTSRSETQTLTPVVARVLRELLKAQAFPTTADLKAGIWRRLAQLRIPAAALEVDEALTIVGSNTRLTTEASTRRSSSRPSAPDVKPISRAEAAAIVAELRERLGLSVRSMPA